MERLQGIDFSFDPSANDTASKNTAPDDTAGPLEAVAAAFPSAPDPQPGTAGGGARARRLYFDSFDWRLWSDGATLHAAETRSGWELVLEDLDGVGGGGERARGTVDGPLPAFAWDLPEGPLRGALTSLLAMRRLLPQVRITTESSTLRILTDDDPTQGKTVARVRWVTGLAEGLDPLRPGQDPGTAEAILERPIRPRLRVLPVRGYDDWRRVADWVREHLEPADEVPPRFEDALSAVGRRPGAYSSKVRLELDPASTAREAAVDIHLHLLDTLLANEDGTRADLDSEFLHDFRVAVRRARSALSQIKGVFDQDVVLRFGAELKWLGGITGPVRDLDVYLLKMPDYEADLPADARADLAPLRAHLARRQREEQALLADHLQGARYRRLVDDWGAFLEQHGQAEAQESGEGKEIDTPPNAHRPVREVASERIWSVYRKIVQRGRKIDDETPDEKVHDLRKDCKKLRYLLEFFRSLYDDSEVEQSIKTLKKLQDLLGDFNDYAVQCAEMGTFAEEMRVAHEAGRSDVPAATFLAMGRLVAHLEDGQRAERAAFGERFAAFAAETNVARYSGLFGPGD